MRRDPFLLRGADFPRRAMFPAQDDFLCSPLFRPRHLNDNTDDDDNENHYDDIDDCDHYDDMAWECRQSSSSELLLLQIATYLMPPTWIATFLDILDI